MVVWEDFGPLIGVVLGGLGALGTTWFVEWRRDAREKRAERRALRKATRMLREELRTIYIELDEALRADRWWNRAELVFEMPYWDRFAEVVAGSDLHEHKWAKLSDAHGQVQRLNETLVRAKRGSGQMVPPFNVLHFEDFVRTVRPARDAVKEAVDVLEALLPGDAAT